MGIVNHDAGRSSIGGGGVTVIQCEEVVSDDDETYPYVVFDDANGRERDSPRPYLDFNIHNGTFTIADDWESSNDPTARDFVLHKNDVIKLAAALLRYAMHGTTSTAECSSQCDVEDRLFK
jgi:hypothetical protein